MVHGQICISISLKRSSVKYQVRLSGAQNLTCICHRRKIWVLQALLLNVHFAARRAHIKTEMSECGGCGFSDRGLSEGGRGGDGRGGGGGGHGGDGCGGGGRGGDGRGGGTDVWI